MSEIDPVTLEVARNGCAAVAEEMTATLVRTAYSPNITERRDCSCAIFDAAGAMVNQAETIPVHLGAMPFSVGAALDRFPPDSLDPGDAVLLNDPFAGGAHLPDLTVMSPVFDDAGDLLGICANRAHHADVGGAAGASLSAETTEIYQEGIRIPAVKLVEAGDEQAGIVELFLANVRTPAERRGDLRAQQAANETGRTRLSDLATRLGTETLRSSFSAILDYSERRMRTAIREVPDGEYRAEDILEDDGHGNTDLPIVVSMTVEDDEILVDFSGTAEQTTGPVNAVFAVTASATYYALRCLTDPTIPPNAGCYRPITIETPSASLVDAEPPAAVVGGNLEVSQRVTDVLLAAIGESFPERSIAGSQGTMNNVTFAGTDPRTGTPFAFYETEPGGMGARSTGDGLDGVQVHMTNTMNTPVEALETAYPLRVERYELRPDSSGPGTFRGGLGIRRDIRATTEATLSLLSERRVTGARGLAGGMAGSPGENVLFRNGEKTPLAAKGTQQLGASDVVSIRTPGGGGYGDPVKRTQAALDRDRRLGYLTEEHVEQYYDDLTTEES